MALQKIGLLGGMWLGLALLVCLYIFSPTNLAQAERPQPTPTALPAEPDAPPCRLAAGQTCDFSRLSNQVGISSLVPKLYPALSAREVPTYTLVSIVFGQAMDSSTINQDSFYVNSAGGRVAGSLVYITASQIAVFYPEAPWQPNTTYTATVTTGVKNTVGEPLPAEISWSFTTWSEPFIVGEEALAANSAVGGLQIYFGDLHSHTGYSDGQGTPAQAFTTAKATGLNFLALTDHDIMLTDLEWQDTLTQANASTQNGVFVGLRGFEFTHDKGHLNVFSTDTFVRGNDPAYQDLNDFYTWLIGRPGAVGQFNHPQPGFNFNNFAYNPPTDQPLLLRELSTAEQFLLSLNAGWHVGTLLNSDTHSANWGAQRFMGLLAPALTKEAILDALRVRRTFFVSPSGQRVALAMQANGYWMGSAIPNTAVINFTITVHDPDTPGSVLYLNLYDNGTRIASAALPGTTVVTWQPIVTGRLGHYYYAEAYHKGWLYAAYSSPIWVEQPPVAEAGASQTVAPGALVTLDGRASWDPDGDALAYRWTQTTGPAVSLNQTGAAQATFTAPAELGQLKFTLIVTDPGGLSADDLTTVTVTNEPILAIVKTGPAEAPPGARITYTLTVTNSGISTATNIVITDAVPVGAYYVNGGAWQPGNVVSWTLPSLPAGELAQVSFVVTATQGIANRAYRVSCVEGVSASGQQAVLTNWRQYYLPIMMKMR